jgi:D-alanyl-D-alanine carboxypeptidase (penicillin-binding protein 5/6)
MFAQIGTSIPLEDLIRGVIVQSGNDACVALAEGLSGTEQAFAEEMNLRAREMGLKKSHFTNATGWPDPEHVVTARELAMIARHIIYNLSEYYHYYSEKEFTWNNIKQHNRNPLLFQDIGADGLKTGHTDDSGYGLVASAQQEDRRLILVLNGMKSSKQRAEEARKLLDWGFRSFKKYVAFEKGAEVGSARVWGGLENTVSLVPHDEVALLLTRLDRKTLKAQIVYDGPLKAPIKEGDQVARLRVISDDQTLNEVPLYAATDVGQGGIIGRAFDTLKFMVIGG